MSRLLHELIGEAGRRYTDFDDAEHSGDATASIVALIVELLPLMPSSSGTASSVWVPRLETELLRPIAIAMEDDPGDPTSVEEWARRLGLSVRHLHRVFKAETGVTLSTWKALHHVARAQVMLAAGDQVTRVAANLGYGSTSSFIQMFKRHTGRTPRAVKDQYG